MSRTIVDVHILQSVPPSNLNRDDTGSPKSATYGGVRRARVSSQAWKRATRFAFRDQVDPEEFGVRTKRVVELLAGRVHELDADVAEPDAAALSVLTAAGIKVKEPRGKKDAPAESGYLLFLSAQQVDALARLAVDAARSGDAPDKKMAQSLIKGKNSVDLALFGRMVADVTDLNVDASCQVAHALSTHAVDTEYDYFTAVDDHKSDDAEEDAGAGMIGTVEFNSATLYRYATVDVDLLAGNIGSAAATERAVRVFLDAFAKSMPTGKQNTFANRTLPDAVVLSVRDDQPVNYVGAFEEPVVTGAGKGRMAESARRLARYADDVETAYGSAPLRTWVVAVGGAKDQLAGFGETSGFEDAVVGVSGLVAERLAAEDR
ncbi:type I-E CRISPR-associated protein Cas7/Cse4/CasC [Isoptericola sp. BMS4]|uniref:type I-E CRISPR-associated protein Cas7/Cse4/CasC n=1 Tax=Isoptericola sp. BMS4 TaxID=2527875 RepID=UPI001422F393|nr:type I-E CRISPR-associated protein Cas7/Cse4/CasC [Isoptericola sp. BMS4]